MGSPRLAATILETLCTKLHPPLAVVTQPPKAAGRGQKLTPTAVESFAKSQALSLFSTANVNTPETVEALKRLAPDLILVAAFGQILRNEILTLPRLFCLNVHASLLPKYRGAAPIQRAIWNGDRLTGITIQKMAKKLDTGAILLQRNVHIAPKETSGELMDRLAYVGAECLTEAVELIDSDKYAFTPQEDSEATYAPKMDRHEAKIDWTSTAQRVFDQIRALQPWPVAETVLGKDRLKVFKATVVENTSKSNPSPGDILTDGKTHLSVVCGDGKALSLTEIQLENRKRLDIKEFLLGFRGNFPHKKLGD